MLHISHVCNSNALCPNLKMFLLKPILFGYCKKFLVATSSIEVMKGYINMLLNFPTFFISRAKFSYILIFSATNLGGLWVKGTAILLLLSLL